MICGSLCVSLRLSDFLLLNADFYSFVTIYLNRSKEHKKAHERKLMSGKELKVELFYFFRVKTKWMPWSWFFSA